MSQLSTATNNGQVANVDVTLAIFVQMNALIAAAAGIQLTQWLAREETSGRIGYSLAAPVSRSRWWASATCLTAGWSILLLLCAGLFTGLGLTAGFDDWSYLGHGLTATLAYCPAVILFVGIATVFSSFTPRLVAVAWLAFGWGTIVCLRADLFRIPEWARNLSPLNWVAVVPREAWHGAAALTMTLAAIVLTLGSTVIFRRRDLKAG
jgi:ABC-2 type transport system permease protein